MRPAFRRSGVKAPLALLAASLALATFAGGVWVGRFQTFPFYTIRSAWRTLGTLTTLPEAIPAFNRECIAIDALPAMRAHPDPESLHYPKDGHCTEAGYALIADVVVRELDARGMLPETLRRADQPAAASIPPGER